MLKYITTNWSGFPYYNVRVFERNSVDQDWQKFRDIKIKTNTDNELFPVFSNLATSLQGSHVKTIDPLNQGQNNIFATINEREATITFSKDIYGVKHATDFIDINIGDNMLCKYYQPINAFYQGLAKLNIKQTTEEDIIKLLRLNSKQN